MAECRPVDSRVHQRYISQVGNSTTACRSFTERIYTILPEFKSCPIERNSYAVYCIDGLRRSWGRIYICICINGNLRPKFIISQRIKD